MRLSGKGKLSSKTSLKKMEEFLKAAVICDFWAGSKVEQVGLIPQTEQLFHAAGHMVRGEHLCIPTLPEINPGSWHLLRDAKTAERDVMLTSVNIEALSKGYKRSVLIGEGCLYAKQQLDFLSQCSPPPVASPCHHHLRYAFMLQLWNSHPSRRRTATCFNNQMV